MNTDNRIPDGNGHLTTKSITEWITGECTANLQLEYEQHCVRCSECREQAAMISQSMQPDEEMFQSTEFQEMLRVGEDVALRVWKEQRELVEPEPEPVVPKPEKKPWLERLIPARQPSLLPAEVLRSPRQESLVQYVWGQPALRLATITILLMAAGIPGYLYWQNNQPVNRSMASMKLAWDRNRPIEARVTGDFPHLPYIVTRGPGDTVSVNQAQLLAATADLAREVAYHPTPRAKHALGRLHLLKAEFDEAEKLLKEVVSEEPRNAQAYVDLASVYYERGVQADNLLILAQAAEYLTKATEISPRLPEVWFNLALCHERMFLPKQAQDDWKKYLELDPGSPWAAEARAHLARLVNPNKSFVAPDRLAEDLLAAAASEDEEKFRQLVLNNFIIAYDLLRGDFLGKYLEARTADDRTAAAKYLDIMRRTARLAREEKEEHYPGDLVIFVASAKQPVIEKIVEICSMLRQGDQSHEKSKYQDALAFYEKAAAMADQVQDICHAEHARYGLARIYISSIETPKRQRLRERLVGETGKRNHKVLYARSLLALANAYGATQLLTKCLEVSTAAYETARLLGDFDIAISSLRFSGTARTDLGEFESAIASYFQAIQIVSEQAVSRTRRCTVYRRIANTLNLAINSKLALAYQLESLTDCQLTNNPSLWITVKSEAGLYFALTGQDKNAEAMFKESIAGLESYEDKLGEYLLRTQLSILLGDSYFTQGRTVEAVKAYRTALSMITNTEQRYYVAMAHQGLAAAWLKLGCVDEAAQELQLSIDLAEETRDKIDDISSRSTFRYRKLNTYRTMMEFQATARSDLEKAFYFAEFSRNRELFDTLAAQSEIKWESNKAKIESASSFEIPDLLTIKKMLPGEVQLVEYAITDQQLLIWLITKDKWKSYKVKISNNELQQSCSEYLRELQSIGNIELLNSKAAELHRKLIEPLLSDLDKNRILVIVPDGVLTSVPFASLFSKATGRYLIQDFAVVAAPSAAVLSHTLKLGHRKLGTRSESALIVSDPRFDPKRFPSLKPLPATQQEEERIRSYYHGTLWLSREQATKRVLLKNINRFDVLHLATHSIVNESNPLLSSVILASDSEINEVAMDENLRAFEIFRLHLNHPRLVILSSCRSGLTAQSPGNGMGSLAHAFFKAGVPAVIASLWEIEDRSAAELMSDFHYQCRIEKQPLYQALRHAQMKMLEGGNAAWRHPYYWAAFQLSGNAFTG